MIQYRNAAMRAPQDGPIRLALGKVLMQQGDFWPRTRNSPARWN